MGMAAVTMDSRLHQRGDPLRRCRARVKHPWNSGTFRFHVACLRLVSPIPNGRQRKEGKTRKEGKIPRTRAGVLRSKTGGGGVGNRPRGFSGVLSSYQRQPNPFILHVIRSLAGFGMTRLANAAARLCRFNVTSDDISGPLLDRIDIHVDVPAVMRSLFLQASN
jgi:hypothetical protein